MLRSARVAAVFVFLSAALYAADPQLMGLVMPEAKLVGGINVVEAKSTPFGQFILNRMGVGDKGFEELITATGFDPRRDLTEIVLASTGEPGSSRGVLLARGAFDVTRIAALMRGAGKTPEIYKGVEIIGGKQEAHVLAFLDGGTAVAGDMESVKAAIDRRARPTRLDAAVTHKIDELSASQHIWGITTAPLANFSLQAPDPKVGGILEGDLFKTIDRASAGLRFGETVQLNAEAAARTEKDAAALADALKFLANLAGMQSQKNRSMNLSGLLASMKLTSESNLVKLALEMPETDFENLIMPPPPRQ